MIPPTARTLTNVTPTVNATHAEATPSQTTQVSTSPASPDSRFDTLRSFQQKARSPARPPTLATLPNKAYRMIADHLPLQDAVSLAQIASQVTNYARLAAELKPLHDAQLWANNAESLQLNDLLQLLGARPLSEDNITKTSIDKLAPAHQEEIFKQTALRLLNLISAHPAMLEPQDLDDCIVTLGNIRPENYRAVATGGVASLLRRMNLDPVNHQKAFDKFEELVGTYPLEHRGAALASLSANIFKLPSKEERMSEETVKNAASNVSKILAHSRGLDGKDPVNSVKVLTHLISLYPLFVSNNGNWKARVDETIAATRETSPQTQMVVWKNLEAFLSDWQQLVDDAEYQSAMTQLDLLQKPELP